MPVVCARFTQPHGGTFSPSIQSSGCACNETFVSRFVGVEKVKRRRGLRDESRVGYRP